MVQSVGIVLIDSLRQPGQRSQGPNFFLDTTENARLAYNLTTGKSEKGNRIDFRAPFSQVRVGLFTRIRRSSSSCANRIKSVPGAFLAADHHRDNAVEIPIDRERYGGDQTLDAHTFGPCLRLGPFSMLKGINESVPWIRLSPTVQVSPRTRNRMLVGGSKTMRTPRRLKLGLIMAFLGLLVVTQGFYRATLTFAQDGSTEQSASEETAPPPDRRKPDLHRPVEQPNRDNYYSAVDASGVVVWYYLPIAVDNRDGQVPVACDPVPGSLFPLGKTTVTCVAADAAGNWDDMIINIIVVDQTAPVFDAPSNVVVDAVDPAGATVNFAVPGAWDNVDGAVAISCDVASGAFFPVGTSTVTCWAQDSAGNSANPVSFNVTVNPPPPPPTEEPTEEPLPTETAEPTEPTDPTEEPTTEPTEEPTAETPVSTEPASTKTPKPTKTPGTDPTETPGSEPTETETPSGNGTRTPTRPSTPTDPTDPTETPIPTPATPTATPVTPEPTPTQVGPDPLELPWPPPEGYVIVTDGGPIDGLAMIWNYYEDAPISQEYGHTEFAIAMYPYYAYGTAYGLDGREHPGIDIGFPRGVPLYSPVDGIVKVAGDSPYFTFYGNGEPGVGQLLIETKEGHEVILGHMGRIVVEVGDEVKVGQFVGLSGGENGDHLHLETREREPLGNLRAVDPRKSFLIASIEEAAKATKVAKDKVAASTASIELEGEDRFRPMSSQVMDLVAVVGEEPTGNAKYAKITVRRVDCAVDETGDIVAACGSDVLNGTAFTVYNPTNHGKTRSTDETGTATFGPRAGQNAITGDDGTGSFKGAYVSCQNDDTGRVLFDGMIDTPLVTLETRPGEQISCDWYDLSWSPSDNDSAANEADHDHDH